MMDGNFPSDSAVAGSTSRPLQRVFNLWLWALIVVLRRAKVGRLLLKLPQGRTIELRGLQPGPEAVIHLHRSRFARRLILGGSIALAETYIDGDWSSPDPAAVVAYGAANREGAYLHIVKFLPKKLVSRWQHRKRANTRSGSRQNIAYHYDLGNEFYAAWLDSSMTYSSAMFSEDDQSLSDAQIAKYRAIADGLHLAPNHHVLEIGCGWGGFAEYAARRHKCRVTAITISEAQYNYAKARMERAGITDLVEVQLKDYRNLAGRYDRIVSIEMIEAVGQEHWPKYFERLKTCLAPGGEAAIQVILINDPYFEEYRSSADFIQKYIFPGGMLPSPSALSREIHAADLTMISETRFGLSYARTLDNWAERFFTAWPAIAEMGFDVRFRRLWEFYLRYCEAGFRLGRIDVAQVRIGHR